MTIVDFLLGSVEKTPPMAVLPTAGGFPVLARLRKLPALCILAATAILMSQAYALDVRTAYSDDGRPMFELRFHEPHEVPYPDWPASWSLSDGQKDRMSEVVGRWAQILRPYPETRTGILNIYTMDGRQAFASSDTMLDEGLMVSRLRNALLGRPDTSANPPGSPHADVVIGTIPLDDGEYDPSQSGGPNTGYDLASVAFHELAHAMGITTSVLQQKDNQGRNLSTRPYFSTEPTQWNSLLRDDNGRAARPGQIILCSACDHLPNPDAFDVRQDRGYVTGAQVSDVLEGSMPGVPVKMLYPNGVLDTDYMSHLELDNSVMSHQFYRNYTTFMEAELAVLQTLGYDIDRRRLFGRSVYGSGQTIDNQNGYYARLPDASAYLIGSYSEAKLGMGLHIYGGNNHITQRADLLTRGSGAVGIRVDGQANDLIVPAGVQIHGLGANGAGVQFSYGRHHTLVHRGDIQATGPNGVGIKADFGNNGATNERMVRGSYLFCDGGPGNAPCLAPWRSNRPLLPELDGPLLSRLDIAGRVSGSSAAIEASENALIAQIDILRGAQIEGDIRSGYVQHDEQGKLRLTRLIMGRLADANGRAIEEPDPQFEFAYAHDLVGENLSLRVAGGRATLDGRHRLHDVAISRAATLAGEGQYTITGLDQEFLNQGTLVPGDGLGATHVIGDYRQSPAGLLDVSFDAAGDHGRLLVEGKAELKGELRLRALPGWYGPGWQMDTSNVIVANASKGGFEHTVVELKSPTLSTRFDSGRARLHVFRDADAYARWGRSDGGLSVGSALDNIVGNAPPAMQPLYWQLDFSSPTGGEASVLLTQLAPTSYAALTATQYDALRSIGDALEVQRRSGSARLPGESWTGFLLPFHQEASRKLSDATDFRHRSSGVVVGAERRIGISPWTLGAHTTLSTTRLTLGRPLQDSARSTQWQLGMHLDYAADARQGPVLQSQWRLGRAEHQLRRNIDSAGYSASHEAKWHSLSMHGQVSGSYLWSWSDKLSAGPVAALDYVWLREPERKESGPDASRLTLAAAHHQSLRASLGWKILIGSDLSQSQSTNWQSHIQLTRDQELLGNPLLQHAAFELRPDMALVAASDVAGRGAWRLQAGLSHQTSKLTLSAYLEGQLAASRQHQVVAQFSVGWRF